METLQMSADEALIQSGRRRTNQVLLGDIRGVVDAILIARVRENLIDLFDFTSLSRKTAFHLRISFIVTFTFQPVIDLCFVICHDLLGGATSPRSVCIMSEIGGCLT
jgi:hypothetical protein